MHTQSGKVHEAGKCDHPEARGVNKQAPVDLEGDMSAARASGGSIKQLTDQKTIR